MNIIVTKGPVEPGHSCLKAHGTDVGVRFAKMQRNLMASTSQGFFTLWMDHVIFWDQVMLAWLAAPQLCERDG